MVIMLASIFRVMIEQQYACLCSGFAGFHASSRDEGLAEYPRAGDADNIAFQSSENKAFFDPFARRTRIKHQRHAAAAVQK